MSTKPEMTPQERLLAAFRRQPCDRVPFAPLVEGYFQASLPDGRERRTADVQYEASGHVLVRAGTLQVSTPLWLGAAVTDLSPGIEQRGSSIDGDILHTVETPVGSLTWRLRFAPESPYIPWVIENRIHTIEDVKVFQYLIERTTFSMDTSYFEEQQSYVGERGVVAVIGPISPLQQMINFEMGLENVIYMLADYPDEMHEMLDTYHAKQVEMWKALAEVPAEVYFIHDNLSTTTTSRAMYRRYDRRYVNEYADILHAAGKKLMTHWCGKLSGFAEDFPEARQDGVSDVTPPPTGDLDIVEARRTWAQRLIMIGGIDPTLFARGTPPEMDAYVADLLERMGPDRRGFILGSGDAVPYGTPPENLRAAAEAATRFRVE
jgi:uroporphyrinogen-III decarboxylase